MMTNKSSLEKFVTAQQQDYAIALAEVTRGRKRSHWMWYIFPQVRGLGFSGMAEMYAISDLLEAGDYLRHPVLGPRLIEICEALLNQKNNNASDVFGSPDDLKLRSSMTLFAEVEGAHPVFSRVLERFYGGKKDGKTLALLAQK